METEVSRVIMVSKTYEKALETAIEKALTGTCLKWLGNGFYFDTVNDFYAQYAIDETRFWHFLESRQKDELD